MTLWRHFGPKMTPFLPFFNNLSIFFLHFVHFIVLFYPYKPRWRLLSINNGILWLKFLSIPIPYLALWHHFSPKMTPFLPFFNNLNIFWTFWLLSCGFYANKPRLRLLSMNGIFWMEFFSKYSIYHAEQPQPMFIWLKNTLKLSNAQNLLKL